MSVEGTAAPPAGEPRVEPAPPEPDDLAQVVLRDLLAGVLASLGACGAALASLAAFRPEDLVGRPGPALAFALGGGLGAGAAFAAAELADGLAAGRLAAGRRQLVTRGLAAGLGLGLLSPLAPLGGAFELLLVETGSSAEAARLVAAALNAVRPEEVPAFVGFSLALGLPLLATRRLGWGLLSQATATTGPAAGLLLVWLLLGPWRLALPIGLLVALLLGGAVAAPLALALADRLVRCLRARPTPPVRAAAGQRRRRLVAGAVLSAIVLPIAAVVDALPGVRAGRLRLWLLAMTTRDPDRLARLHDASSRLNVHAGWTPTAGGRPVTVTRGTPLGPPPLSGLDLDAVARALDLWLPGEGPEVRLGILRRTAAAGVPGAMHELGVLLLADGALEARDEARRLFQQAAWSGHLPAAQGLRQLHLSEESLAELDACYLERVREGDRAWVEDAAALWSLGMADRPSLDALSRALVARADRGDVGALAGLEARWRCGRGRPEVETLLARWAAGGALAGDPTLTSWRALEALVRLARSSGATPSVVEAALAAARRHALVETALASSPTPPWPRTVYSHDDRPPGPPPEGARVEEWRDPALWQARRVLLELVAEAPERRRLEDEWRLPLLPVPVRRVDLDVMDLEQWESPGSREGPRYPSSRLSSEALRAALATTPALPTGPDGAAGRAALLAAAAGERERALGLALAALASEPRDPDAHRALARLDLARALEGRLVADDVDRWVVRRSTFDRAALSRAEAHLWVALAVDPASAGACLERALVIAALEDRGEPTRAHEVHAWLALGDRVGPPGCAAPTKAALRSYLCRAAADVRFARGVTNEPALLQRRIVERWRAWALGAARRDPGAAARTLEAARRASRRARSP